MRIAALVLRRTRTACAAQDERNWGCGASMCGCTHQLMVSSAALPRVRRTMGDEVALADAVLRAQVIDISADCRFEVHVGPAVRFEALLGLGPILRRGERAERHKAMVPAEAALGLAPEGEVETRFGVGEEDRDGVEDGFCDLLSAHGCKAAADHEDHQRPEAEHDTQQGRDVTWQPEGQASTFHGRHYKCARSPADLRNANPPYFSRKSLRLLETRKSELLCKCGSHPTKWGVTLAPRARLSSRPSGARVGTY